MPPYCHKRRERGRCSEGCCSSCSSSKPAAAGDAHLFPREAACALLFSASGCPSVSLAVTFPGHGQPVWLQGSQPSFQPAVRNAMYTDLVTSMSLMQPPPAERWPLLMSTSCSMACQRGTVADTSRRMRDTDKMESPRLDSESAIPSALESAAHG